MIFTMTEILDRDERVYTLRITNDELVRARLQPFDRLLIADCEGKDSTISDKLLALETIARRIEEGSGDIGGEPR
jgi:hypothetical protein